LGFFFRIRFSRRAVVIFAVKATIKDIKVIFTTIIAGRRKMCLAMNSERSAKDKNVQQCTYNIEQKKKVFGNVHMELGRR